MMKSYYYKFWILSSVCLETLSKTLVLTKIQYFKLCSISNSNRHLLLSGIIVYCKSIKK